MVKNLPANIGEAGDPLKRKWQHIPVYLPGKPHGHRSLVGYSPWGPKELVTTEHTGILLNNF